MEQIKQIVKIFNNGDVFDADSIFSPAYIDHQNDSKRSSDTKTDGPEEFKQIVIGARSSLPNLTVTIEDVFSSDNKVAARLHWHSEDNGKVIDRETIDLLRIENDLVVEHWGVETWRSNS